MSIQVISAEILENNHIQAKVLIENERWNESGVVKILLDNNFYYIGSKVESCIPADDSAFMTFNCRADIQDIAIENLKQIKDDIAFLLHTEEVTI